MASKISRKAETVELARIVSIRTKLTELFSDAECALHFRNPLELLIATILSAQCTDVRVNQVTQELFKKYRSAEDFANVPQAVLEQEIHSTGFFRNKAKNIIACCQELITHYDGEVPAVMEQLVRLPGVGRKTANCVMGNGFGEATGVVVDTHVQRLSRRLGLVPESMTDPVKIERELMRLIPQEEWITFSHRLILHGRKTCNARRPDCSHCPLAEQCPRNGVQTQ